MSKLRLLVSLVVGSAQESANQHATRVAVETMEASDLGQHARLDLAAYLNGSSDRLLPLADWLRGRGWLVDTCHDRIVGIGEARNVIMGYDVGADYVMELHNDMVFSREWAGPIFAGLAADPELAILGPGILSGRGAFGGPVLADIDLAGGDAAELASRVDEAAAAAVSKYGDSMPRIRRGLSCPCVKRLSALSDPRVGGPYYPAEFGWQEFEDTDEARRLEAAGYRIGICLDSWVYHAYVFSRLATRDDETRTGDARRAFFAKYPDATEWLAGFNEDLNRMHEIGAIA